MSIASIITSITDPVSRVELHDAATVCFCSTVRSFHIPAREQPPRFQNETWAEGEARVSMCSELQLGGDVGMWFDGDVRRIDLIAISRIHASVSAWSGTGRFPAACFESV